MTILLQKKGVKSREYYIRRLRQMLETNTNYFKGKVREWLNFENKKIRDDLTDRFLKDEVAEIIEWGAIEAKGREVMKAATMAVIERGGKLAVESINRQAIFDAMTSDIVSVAEKNTMQLVTNVTDETKAGMRWYISQGLAEGKGMPKIAREMRPIAGLTERQIKALDTYKRKLLEESPGISDERLRKKIGVQARKKNRYRASRIARTEAARAQNLGYCRGLESQGIDTVEFSSSPGACDICVGLNGTKYDVRTGAHVIPVHPSCRCCLLPVV